MNDRSKRLTAIALLVLPAMLMLAAADPKPEKKGGSAVWIALAAVFVSLGAAFAANRGSAAKKRGDGNGSDAMIYGGGSDSGHHKDSHASDHSSGDWGSDGGGGDGGGGGGD